MTSTSWRGRDDLARMDVLLGPGHFRDVNEALDARLEFHERTVVGDVRDTAGEACAPSGNLSAMRYPRDRLMKLLHAEADALGFA